MMTQLDNIEAIEKRLWASADNLRAMFIVKSRERYMILAQSSART